MSSEEYWNGESSLVIPYRKAHQLKQKQQNYNAWLQGMYFYDALTRVAPIFNAFAKEGSRTEPYLEEPYPITREDKDEQERRKNERIRREQLEHFKAMVANFNKEKQ
nr:MAG TPA: hypothetical protein [Caudoviricetes sp.]